MDHDGKMMGGCPFSKWEFDSPRFFTCASNSISCTDHVFFSNCEMHLYPIAKCLCIQLQNVFVSNYEMYFSQISKCICLKLQNVFASSCEMYLSQITKCISLLCIFLKQGNVFVSNCKMYLSPILKCICIKLQNVFQYVTHILM